MAGKGGVVVSCVIVALLSIAPAAVALPPPAPDAVAEAARLDASAAKLAKSGATREAIAALRRSEELVPKRATLEKIATLQRQERDFAGAHATYVDMLTRFDAELKPKERNDIRHSLDELAAITGAIHLKVAEAGAHIEVDGTALADGPLDTTVRVNLGAHTVKVSKPHFDPFEWKGEAPAGAETVVVAELKATPGTLSVRVKGAPTTVRIDGNEVGPTPWQGQLPAGKHVVETGDAPRNRKEVEIVAGEEAQIEMEGETRGRIAISVEPASASITVDGKPRGVGAWEGPIEAGPHDLEVAAEGFEPAHLTIISLAGALKSQRIQLRAVTPPPRFDGVYAILGANFAGSPSLHNYITDVCAAAGENCKGSGGAFGAEIPIRIGYSLGYLGIEGVSLVRYDQMNMTQEVSAQPLFKNETIGFMFYRVTVANGVAVRFMPKTQVARLSTSLGLAWSHEILGLSATVHHGHDFPHPSTHGDAPMLLFDVGVLLGSTPGTKFRLAFESTFEFVGSGFSDPTVPSVLLAHGTVVFLGPSLGVQIGH